MFFWSTWGRRWTLGAFLIALALTATWGWLDARFGMQTGLRYAVYRAGEESSGAPLAVGIVGLSALQGEGVSSLDESRLTRGAGRHTVRLSGRWYVPKSGAYEIFLAGSGRLAVKIDGNRVVRNRSRSNAATSGVVELDEGFHHLLVTLRRSDRRPRLTVHWAPVGEAPRRFDRYSLFPQRESVERYTSFRWLLVVRRLSLLAWAVAALLVVGPAAIAGVARLGRLARRFWARSDGVMIAGLIGSAVFLIATLFRLELRRLVGFGAVRLFSLLGENNFAAWWSGALLLLAALYAVDAASRGQVDLLAGRRHARSPALLSAPQRSARLGWSCVAIVLAALSADEIGRFHEFMDLIIGWGTWWSLLPFALALLGVVAVGGLALWSIRELRPTVVALAAGFAVLGTIPPLLEFAEHARNWGVATTWSHPHNLRATLEEGSELVGMLILLHACVWGRVKMFDGPESSPAKSVGPDPIALRRPLLIAGWPVAIGAALVSLRLPPAMSPEIWFVTAFFLVAAVTSYFHRPSAAGSRAIAVVGLVGSVAGTVFTTHGPVWLGVSVALILVWLYIRRERPEAPGWWLPVLSMAVGLLLFVGDWPVGSALRPAFPQLLGLVALALTGPLQRNSVRRHRLRWGS